MGPGHRVIHIEAAVWFIGISVKNSNMQVYKDNFVQYILSIPELVTAGPILGKLLRH